MKGPSKETRPVSESAIDDYFYQVFPTDLNAAGSLFGGRLMEVADRVAGNVCHRHCQWPYAVTAQVDAVRFICPGKQGDTLIFKASVNRVWKSSMEIGVKVLANDYTGEPERHIFSAYFTYVTLDGKGKPIGATPCLPESGEEIRRFDQAEVRRRMRVAE